MKILDYHFIVVVESLSVLLAGDSRSFVARASVASASCSIRGNESNASEVHFDYARKNSRGHQTSSATSI